MKIELHSHFLPRDCYDMVDSKGHYYGHTLEDPDPNNRHHKNNILSGVTLERMSDPKVRIQEMNKISMDIQVISVAPPNINYGLDPDLGLSHAKKYNDGIAEVVRAYPDRFLGLSTLPMQDIPKALKELDRTINQMGFKGIEILTDINGKNLDDPDLWPIFQRAQEMDILIYVHPTSYPRDPKMKSWVPVLVENPFNTSMAISSLIFGGVMEKFPKLKFQFSHTGGFAPYLRGRWEHGYLVWPDCKNIPKPPSEYFKLFYFDTIAHYDPALAFLVDTVGANKVVMGSDYPYVMGDLNPIATVRNAGGISAADKAQILERTAVELLKLKI